MSPRSSLVYRAANPIDAQLVADELRGHGVGCEITGGYLSGAIGELPPGDIVAVRLHDPREAGRARALIEALEAARRDPRPDWSCEACGERVGGEFGACWRCGAGAPPDDGPAPEGPSPGDAPARRGTRAF